MDVGVGIESWRIDGVQADEGTRWKGNVSALAYSMKPPANNIFDKQAGGGDPSSHATTNDKLHRD